MSNEARKARLLASLMEENRPFYTGRSGAAYARRHLASLPPERRAFLEREWDQ